MNWFVRNWKKLAVATCGVVGAVSTVVPALVPITLVCAVAIPAVTTAPDILTGLKNLITALGPPDKK